MTSARLSPTAISYPISIPGPKVIDTRTINLYVLPAKLPTDALLRKSAKRAPHPHDCATWLHLTSADRPGHWQTGLSWHRCTPEYCGAVVVLFIFFFFSFRTALRRTLCIASNATVKIWMQMHYIIMIHLISIVILRCPDCRSSPIRRTEDLFLSIVTLRTATFAQHTVQLGNAGTYDPSKIHAYQSHNVYTVTPIVLSKCYGEIATYMRRGEINEWFVYVTSSTECFSSLRILPWWVGLP